MAAHRPSGHSYPVATLAEMAAMPAEARARFLAELPLILARYAEVTDRYDDLGTALQYATWTDDGDDSAEFHVRVAQP